MVADAHNAKSNGQLTLESSLPLSDRSLADIGAKKILLLNKIDLLSAANLEMPDTRDIELLAVSAKTGEGLTALREKIKTLAGFRDQHTGTFSARRRHLVALEHARDALLQGQRQLSGHQAGELLAEDLRAAQRALEEITGAFSSDDLLGRIFSSFCIGK